MNSKVITSLLFLLCSLAFTQLNAQSGKKSVILIEGEATEVSIAAPGQILEIYRKIPGYMSGFVPYSNQSRPDANPVYPNNQLINQVEIAENGASFYNVFFNEGEDALDDNGIAKLDAAAETFAKRTSAFLLIQGSFTKGNIQSQKLINERVEACQSYLNGTDIPNSKIIISVSDATKASNNIQIQIK